MKKNKTSIVPHILLILTLFHGTLWVLDLLNPLMGFLDNRITNITFAVYILVAGLESVLCIMKQCGEEKNMVSNPKTEERP